MPIDKKLIEKAIDGKKDNQKTIYDQMKALGVEIGNHASDLYVPVTPETTALVNKYEFKQNVTRFICNIDKKPWYDIPFAFMPFWEQRCNR